VRAARDAFIELGYDAATFQEIAIRADLTRPAINHYFASKPSLYREVVEQSNARFLTAGMARTEGETTLPGRIFAFIAPAIHGDSEDRSAAAFLVTSALESRRHPGLSPDAHDSVKGTRAFLTWAVHDAVKRGELNDTDVASLVEILVAMLWGMAFHAAFVGSRIQSEAVTDQLKLLLAGKLWQLSGETVATVEKAKTTRRPVKLSKLTPRTDAPPL